MATLRSWAPADARDYIAIPTVDDDKYSRGVLGVVTGSDDYPGAAVLGVEAALRTGLGMVRYLGPERASTLVLQRRPEVVTTDGRVHAWLIGSGMDAANRAEDVTERLRTIIAHGVPTVIDAGALDLVRDASGSVIITPHYRELARLLDVDAAEIASDPAGWATRAAETLSVTVLLKGHNTYIAGSDGTCLVAATAPRWLATAGAGDALGGILGALVATHASELSRDSSLPAKLAATAAVIHGLAAGRASGGGPLTVLDLAAAVPATIAELLSGYAKG
jgi:hydroxyethylthiazole kinase-like uncharacterized protein yjeF